ncbi:MAG: hypothetical protein FJ098_02680 [Deltaproteobacteria bacterium]|nr:hypothetical protein [Deltaproteobacteria bacterium]
MSLPSPPATACSRAFSYSDVTLVGSYPSTSGTVPADKGVLLVFRPTIKANHNLMVEWYPPKKFQAWKKDGDEWVQIPIVLDEGIEKPPAVWGIGPWSTEPIPLEVFHCKVSAWESGLENGRIYRIRAPGGWTAGVEHEIRFQMANTSAMEIEFAEEPVWYEDSFSFTPSEPSGSGVVSPQKLTVEFLEEQGICDHDCWVSADCEDCTGYARMAQRFHVSLPSLGVTPKTGPRVLRLTATGTDTNTGAGLPSRIHFSFLVMPDHPQTADFTLQRCGPIDGKGADGCEVCFQALIEALDGQLLWDSKEHCLSVYQVPKPEDPCASYAENLDYDEGDEPPTPMPWPACGALSGPEPSPEASSVETVPDVWSSENDGNDHVVEREESLQMDSVQPGGDAGAQSGAVGGSGSGGTSGCTAGDPGASPPLVILLVLLALPAWWLRRYRFASSAAVLLALVPLPLQGCLESNPQPSPEAAADTSAESDSVWTDARNRPDGAPPSADIGADVVCIPDCDGKDCGPDGCGGVCGNCPDGTCFEGACYSCYFVVCDGQQCAPGEFCVEGECGCPENCEGYPCGGDFCGSCCDPCGFDLECYEGTCLSVFCEPDCTDKECGDDGCGGECGPCPEGEECDEGECAVPCVPDCQGKECGDEDGCGSFCLCGDAGGTCWPCANSNDCQEGHECYGGGWGGSFCYLHTLDEADCPEGTWWHGHTGLCLSIGSCKCSAEAVILSAKTPCISSNAYGHCDGFVVCTEVDAPPEWCDAPEAAPELCNGLDDDCNGETDEDCGQCLDYVCADVVCTEDCDAPGCLVDCCDGSCFVCDEGGTCIDGACCMPQCTGKVCGFDGCDGSCGKCPDWTKCVQGQCVVDEPCGVQFEGQVGCDGCACQECTCETDPYCCDHPWDAMCVNTCISDCGGCGACTPDCAGKACGADGCGGTCGSCPGGTPYCIGGTCKAACTPECTGKACGPDGCGGSCGTCPDLEVLPWATMLQACGPDGQCHCARCDYGFDELWNCEADCQMMFCMPSCQGQECGDDGCGGTCGQCGWGAECSMGQCVCALP